MFEQAETTLSPSARQETEKQRLDRNLQDLLAGLRVALPGVQVLFAFLLILPFQSRFESVTGFEKVTYFTTLVLTAVASVLLIAPSAHHRLRFRQNDKRWVVMTGNRLGLVGLACLGLAITGAILLITSFLFSSAAAAVTGAAIAALLAWAWFFAPLRRSLEHEDVGGGGE